MACEVFDSATPRHYSNVIGHVADDGNVYNTALGYGESMDNCVGHIASDGNVYTTARGFGEGTGNCVGHIGANGNVYTNSKFQGDVQGYCAGHVESDGKVYSTPAEASAGVNYCVGQVAGSELEYGAAALLLLLKPGARSETETSHEGGYGGSHSGGGGGYGGGSTTAYNRRRLPPTVYKSEEQLIKAFIARLVGLSVVAGLLGVVLADFNIALGVTMGLLVGAGISLLTLFGFTDRRICKFDTQHCKHGWLGVLLRKPATLGIVLPMAMLVVAALIALSCLSGTPMYSLGLVYLAVLICVGLALGKAIRRWRSK